LIYLVDFHLYACVKHSILEINEKVSMTIKTGTCPPLPQKKNIYIHIYKFKFIQILTFLIQIAHRILLDFQRNPKSKLIKIITNND